MRHSQIVTKVRELVRTSIELRYTGVLHNKKVQAQAYADGYMRALLDCGQLERTVLLRLVGEEHSNAALRSSSGAGTVQSELARPPA